MEKPDITIQTKVGEILEYYPELEEVLLNMSPAFAKLKNPILRKTVAKVASLKQVAEVGNLDLSVLITTLRNAAGLSVSGEDSSDSEILKEERPIWAKNEAVTVVFDACPVINGGGGSDAGYFIKGKCVIGRRDFKVVDSVCSGSDNWSVERKGI